MFGIVDAQRQGKGFRTANLEALVEVHAGKGGGHGTGGRYGIETVAGNIVPRRCAECSAVGAKPCGRVLDLRRADERGKQNGKQKDEAVHGFAVLSHGKNTIISIQSQQRMFFLKAYLVRRQYLPGVRHVRVAVGHGKRVVPSEVLDEHRRHARLEHLGDARVLERVEMICVGQGESFKHVMPYEKQVLGGVQAAPWLEPFGEQVCVGRELEPLHGTQWAENLSGQRDGALLMVLGHFRRYMEQSLAEVYVAKAQHKNFLGTDQMLEAQPHDGDIFVHASSPEIVKYPFPVVFGYSRAVFLLPAHPLERFERVCRCEPVSDKASEHAFEKLEHVVVSVCAPVAITVFRQQFSCLLG